MTSFWLSLFFHWPFWLILLSASTSSSLTLPRHPASSYILSSFYYLLVRVPVPLLCQWFISMHFYFSAFCFSPVPYFTLCNCINCNRHTVLNALTAPNFKILFWGQIKAVQSHYIHYCIVLAQVISLPLCFGEGAELPAEADAEVSTSFRWAGISQLSGFCWQAAREFWHISLHHNVLGSRLQVFLHSEKYWARSSMISEILVQLHGSVSCHPSV